MLNKFSSSFFVSIMSFGLFLLSSCNQNPPITETVIPTSEKTIPVESFVFIKSDVEFDLCTSLTKTCMPKVGEGFGSAVLIAKSEKENLSVIMTAGHICQESEDGLSPYQSLPGVWMIPTNFEIDFTLLDFNGDEYRVISHIASKEFDLCLMTLRGVIPFEPIKIAQQDMKIGEKAFNFAAPGGIWNPKNIPIFEGFYTGKVLKDEKECYKKNCPLSTQDTSNYTIPAMPGSSGSPIINSDFELVGILIAVPNTKRSSHICVGTTLNDIQGFIDEKLPYMLVNPSTY